jgi:hypothetical protein
VAAGQLESKFSASTTEIRGEFSAKNTSKAALFLAGCIPKDILRNLLFV